MPHNPSFWLPVSQLTLAGVSVWWGRMLRETNRCRCVVLYLFLLSEDWVFVCVCVCACIDVGGPALRANHMFTSLVMKLEPRGAHTTGLHWSSNSITPLINAQMLLADPGPHYAFATHHSLSSHLCFSSGLTRYQSLSYCCTGVGQVSPSCQRVKYLCVCLYYDDGKCSLHALTWRSMCKNLLYGWNIFLYTVRCQKQGATESWKMQICFNIYR